MPGQTHMRVLLRASPFCRFQFRAGRGEPEPRQWQTCSSGDVTLPRGQSGLTLRHSRHKASSPQTFRGAQTWPGSEMNILLAVEREKMESQHWQLYQRENCKTLCRNLVAERRHVRGARINPILELEGGGASGAGGVARGVGRGLEGPRGLPPVFVSGGAVPGGDSGPQGPTMEQQLCSLQRNPSFQPKLETLPFGGRGGGLICPKA